jgi:hypothetical protein
MRWETPELLVLQSGAEAKAEIPASGKHQPQAEGVGDSCGPGIGCPHQVIVGPS